MEPRITLITLGVQDLERAARFYVDGLGWERSPLGGDTVAFLRTTGTVLVLWPRTDLAADAGVEPEGSGFRGFALAHNVRDAGEIDTILDRVRATGGTVVHEPIDRDWGGRSAYFADPEGALWEVAWNPHFPFNDDGSVRIP